MAAVVENEVGSFPVCLARNIQRKLNIESPAAHRIAIPGHGDTPAATTQIIRIRADPAIAAL